MRAPDFAQSASTWGVVEVSRGGHPRRAHLHGIGLRLICCMLITLGMMKPVCYAHIFRHAGVLYHQH